MVSVMFEHAPILPGRYAEIRMSLEGYIVPEMTARYDVRSRAYSYRYGSSRVALRPIVPEGM